jgi:hypothetical protein
MKILPTNTKIRTAEAVFEIVFRMVGIFVVFFVFDWLFGSDNDLLISLLVLPTLYILKDSHKVIEPSTVIAEMHSDRVSVTRGFYQKVTDTLEFNSVENTEIISTYLGRRYNYATLRLYSPGGHVEIPFALNPEETLNDILACKSTPNKQG